MENSAKFKLTDTDNIEIRESSGQSKNININTFLYFLSRFMEKKN